MVIAGVVVDFYYEMEAARRRRRRLWDVVKNNVNDRKIT